MSEKHTNETSKQDFLLNVEARREEGSKETALKIQAEITCSANFMANVFHQLFKQDETLKEVVYTVVLKDMLESFTADVLSELTSKNSKDDMLQSLVKNATAQA